MNANMMTFSRECRVVKSEEYAGYGFNLYQEKNKPGQYIGRIEAGSPADKAGLKENDRSEEARIKRSEKLFLALELLCMLVNYGTSKDSQFLPFSDSHWVRRMTLRKVT